MLNCGIDIKTQLERAAEALWAAHSGEQIPKFSVVRTAAMTRALVEILRLQHEIDKSSSDSRGSSQFPRGDDGALIDHLKRELNIRGLDVVPMVRQ